MASSGSSLRGALSDGIMRRSDVAQAGAGDPGAQREDSGKALELRDGARRV